MLFALLFSFVAHAQRNEPPTQPRQQIGNFAFTIMDGSEDGSKSSGCVHLMSASVSATFPNVHGGKVSAIRLYYAQGEAAAVSQTSASFSSQLSSDSQGNLSLTPIEFCGLAAGHYSFKYGLVDASGRMLEFEADQDFDPQANVVDVQ